MPKYTKTATFKILIANFSNLIKQSSKRDYIREFKKLLSFLCSKKNLLLNNVIDNDFVLNFC